MTWHACVRTSTLSLVTSLLWRSMTPGTSRLGGMHRHANGQEGGPNANASSLRGIVPHFALDSTVTHPKV